jgi:hypothetical protein
VKLEVIINDQGSVTIEDDRPWTRKEIRQATEHAADVIRSAQPERRGIGFGAGSGAYVGHGPGSEADPREAGWLER